MRREESETEDKDRGYSERSLAASNAVLAAQEHRLACLEKIWSFLKKAREENGMGRQRFPPEQIIEAA